MKKILVIIAIMLLPNLVQAEKEKLVVVADIWCPYNCQPNSQNEGVLVEIARAALKDEDIEVVYKTMPWARAIDEARDGRIDGIIGAARGDAPDFIFPDISQGKLKDVFLVTDKNKDFKYKNIRSLSDKTLGVIEDYSYGDEFDKYIEKNYENSDLIQASSGDYPLGQNIMKLMKGRLDVVIEDEKVLLNYLKDKNFKGLHIIQGEGKNTSDELYVAFSPHSKLKEKSKKYAKLVSDYTKELKEDGDLKKLYDKYK